MAKNIGINFEQLVQVMEGGRENAKESTGKEEKNNNSENKKKNAAPQTKKEEKKTQLRKPKESRQVFRVFSDSLCTFNGYISWSISWTHLMLQNMVYSSRI